MRTRHRCAALAAIFVAVALATGVVRADDDENTDPPTDFEYEWSADLLGAAFTNSNAWFGQAPAVVGDDIGSWYELGLEPQLAMRMPFKSGTAFASLSVIGTYSLDDDASGLTIGIQDASAVTLEQAHLGWRATDLFDAIDGETFTVTAGSFDYSIGSGLLINDGGSDGAERGGWWLGMRKSFQEALLIQLETETLKLEAFRLANRPRAGSTHGTVLGANAEYQLFPDSTLGGTLMSVQVATPGTDALTVISGRFDRAPEQGFGLSAELVTEQSDQIDAGGGFLQLRYASALSWSPTFSYRYAAFSGDDPGTLKDERFREVAYGYTDYGNWYQGEITGNYPLGNGNLTSHLLRVEMTPREDLTVNALYYSFSFDEPASFGVSASDWGDELDLIVDWAWDDALSFVGVLAVLAPGQAAVQATGGDKEWVLAMLSASYSW